MSLAGRVRSTKALVVVAAGLLVGAAAAPVPAGAEFGAASAFTATASARLAQVTFTAQPPIGLDPLLDPGASTAQAQADSLGVSQAFASSAYPGQSVLTADGTLSTVTDGRIGSKEIPDYPFIASSAFPSRPADNVEVGPLKMTAESSSLSSAGLATDGLGEAVARASSEPSTLEASASAETHFGSIQLGKLVQLHGARSFAAARQAPSGELLTASAFEVASMEVLGTPIAVGPQGLLVSGKPAAPLAPAEGLTALLGALKERGVELSFFPERKIPGGVRAGGLELRLVQTPPQQVASGIDVLVSTITLGGNQATVDNRALPNPGLVAGSPEAPPESGSPTVTTPSTALGTEPAAELTQPSMTGEPPPWRGDAPSQNEPPTNPPAAPPGGDSQAALGAQAITADGLRVRLGGLYPILALSVLVAVAGAGLFRRLTGQGRA